MDRIISYKNLVTSLQVTAQIDTLATCRKDGGNRKYLMLITFSTKWRHIREASAKDLAFIQR